MNETSATKKAAYWWVFGVFLLGLALGGVGGFALSRHFVRSGSRQPSDQDRRAHMVERLSAEVKLSEDQQKRVGEVLDELLAKYKTIHDQSAPQTEAARQQARDQIRAILSPEQRPQFEDFLRRVDEEHKKHHRE
jgi:hypothetical protein